MQVECETDKYYDVTTVHSLKLSSEIWRKDWYNNISMFKNIFLIATFENYSSSICYADEDQLDNLRIIQLTICRKRNNWNKMRNFTKMKTIKFCQKFVCKSFVNPFFRKFTIIQLSYSTSCYVSYLPGGLESVQDQCVVFLCRKYYILFD